MPASVGTQTMTKVYIAPSKRLCAGTWKVTSRAVEVILSEVRVTLSEQERSERKVSAGRRR